MSDLKTAKIIIFTDLDGSLLDHQDYSYDAAKSALERLEHLHIPVIPVTSKTLGEIKAYDALFECVPKIAENGMVIDLPNGYFGQGEYLVPGHAYDEIRDEIKNLPADLRTYLNGFADMGLEGVIETTGLPRERAKLAHQRKASEPFLWSGSAEEMQELVNFLKPQGYKITQGGRFYHLMSEGGKDKAVQILIDKFKKKYETDRVVSIALGDGPNDADMLGAVDYGVKIPNEKGVNFNIENPQGQIIDAPYAGPRGWNACVHSLLDELGLSR